MVLVMHTGQEYLEQASVLAAVILVVPGSMQALPEACPARTA